MSLADDNFAFRVAIDKMLGSTSLYKISNTQSSQNTQTTNNDEKGVKKADGLFRSFELINGLSKEQKNELKSKYDEIKAIEKLQQELAKNEDAKKSNDKTLEDIFKQNSLSIDGIDKEKLKSKDYDTIQEELKKAREKKQNKYDELKTKIFGEKAPAELEDINIDNIDTTESANLNNLMADTQKAYTKCENAIKALKDFEEDIQREINAINSSSISNEEKNKRLQDLKSKNQSKYDELKKAKADAEIALIKARKKASEYGQKAAKDNKTIKLEG